MWRQGGEPLVAEDSEEQTTLRPQYKHGREQSARRPRRVGHRPKCEPKQENSRQDGNGLYAGEGALRDGVAAADPIGSEPRRHPDCCADERRTQFHWPSMKSLCRGKRAEE